MRDELIMNVTITQVGSQQLVHYLHGQADNLWYNLTSLHSARNRLIISCYER